MTLQWAVIAAILYSEVILTLILLFPWIRPATWRRIFNSNLVKKVSSFTSVAQYSTIVVLLLLFADAVREVRKYSNVDTSVEVHRIAEADAIVHMRLFRAQRNLYISGFALLLFLVINRLVTLILRNANLAASAEASLKQAENASNTARRLITAEGSDEAVATLQKTVDELKTKLEKAEKDRDAIKTQAENLHKEYSRLSDEVNSVGPSGDKKAD